MTFHHHHFQIRITFDVILCIYICFLGTLSRPVKLTGREEKQKGVEKNKNIVHFLLIVFFFEYDSLFSLII